MDIYTVRDKLKHLIQECNREVEFIRAANRLVKLSTESQVDIVNKKRINYESLLSDVEVCCKKAIEDSWKGSADRQGGSFDASESNRETW
jgi:hypothetical protein